MSRKLLSEPAAPDPLCLAIVVRSHDRIRLHTVGKSFGRVRGQAIDAERVVVDDATSE